MVMRPFREVLVSIARCVGERLGIDADAVARGFDVPREEFGDLSIVLPRASIPRELWDSVEGAVRGCAFVAECRRVGIYVNMRLDRARFAELVARACESPSYGYLELLGGTRIVVEYVSANPIHPLHVGAARNAALGQSLARLLRAAGAEVQTRYYINDVGRQVAIMALGMSILGEYEPPPGFKEDHWVGIVYAMTNLFIEVEGIRRELALADDARRSELLKELDSRLADLARLKDVAPDLFEKLSNEARKGSLSERVSQLMRAYEAGEEWAKSVVRRAVELCLRGIRATLERFGAPIDVWDWESDLVWSSEVRKVLEMLRRSPYATMHKGVPAIDFSPILKDRSVRERLRIPPGLEIPPLVLMRSDATTLYTVRDIAYTLKKFREFRADKVINVIGSEQVLPQAQLRLALYILGYRREAENLIHYSYEMVQLSGTKMSSRRGRIVTLDEILDEASKRALRELEARGSADPGKAERIGVAAVKFALLSVTPSRPIRFEWENVLSFERNSAPYLLYTYARARGIERKAEERGIPTGYSELLARADLSKLTESDRRWRLVKLVAQFPEVFASAVESLDPSQVATYILRLADEFNSWYDEDPVLREPDEGLRYAKMLLVKWVERVISNALKLLGIEPLDRM